MYTAFSDAFGVDYGFRTQIWGRLRQDSSLIGACADITWWCLSATVCSTRLPSLGSNWCPSVDRTGSLTLLFLGVCSGRPGLRGSPPDLLRRGADRLNIWLLAPSSRGERVGRCWGSTTGEVLRVFAAFRAFLSPLGLIWFRRVVPGWPARSGLFELGTSRIVGKQGERGDAVKLR